MAQQSERRATDSIFIDCDVHHVWERDSEIRPYLPESWRRGPLGGPGHGYSNPIGVMRRDAVPAKGGLERESGSYS